MRIRVKNLMTYQYGRKSGWRLPLVSTLYDASLNSSHDIYVQWTLTYPDTYVPKLTVRISEYPDKLATFHIYDYDWFPNMCLEK